MPIISQKSFYMLSFLKKLLKKITLRNKYSEISRKCTLNGFNYKFGRSSAIELRFGSKIENISLGNNVWMYGVIISSSGGKVQMMDNTKIGAGSKITAVNKVVVGKYSAIATGVVITDNNNHPINPEDRKFMRLTPEDSEFRDWKYSDNGPIIIGENVWVGADSRILKGVTIGNNSIVAACSVVTKDIPENCIAAGNPAKIVRENIDNSPRVFSENE